ncbi:hypothetical protein JOD24_002775 [Kroppenstedtia sanguinis]
MERLWFVRTWVPKCETPFLNHNAFPDVGQERPKMNGARPFSSWERGVLLCFAGKEMPVDGGMKLSLQ